MSLILWWMKIGSSRWVVDHVSNLTGFKNHVLTSTHRWWGRIWQCYETCQKKRTQCGTRWHETHTQTHTHTHTHTAHVVVPREIINLHMDHFNWRQIIRLSHRLATYTHTHTHTHTCLCDVICLRWCLVTSSHIIVVSDLKFNSDFAFNSFQSETFETEPWSPRTWCELLSSWAWTSSGWRRSVPECYQGPGDWDCWTPLTHTNTHRHTQGQLNITSICNLEDGWLCCFVYWTIWSERFYFIHLIHQSRFITHVLLDQ